MKRRRWHSTPIPEDFARQAGREVVESGLMQIDRVRKVEIDGRPQLVLDVMQDGVLRSMPLDRETARMMTKALGRHPLVEAFFADGEGLQ